AGPRMKCCESITDAMARSTSALIERYCALRSSRGTCIGVRLLQFPIRLGSAGQCFRERRVLVEVEALEHTRLDLLVAVPRFAAPEHAIGVGRVEPMAMTAHPSDLARPIADDQI